MLNYRQQWSLQEGAVSQKDSKGLMVAITPGLVLKAKPTCDSLLPAGL